MIRTACFFVCLCLSLGTAKAADRPNIVFFFTDDHAPHAIGAVSDFVRDLNPTPTLDQMAADGILFTNSFCTNSICGPSRAVIITGKHSHKNGFRNNGDTFNGDQQTFPKLLREAGYYTALYGKWHLKTTPQGFDEWAILPGQGEYYNPRILKGDIDTHTLKGPQSRGEQVTLDGYCTDVVTDLALDYLEEQAKTDKPFLLMCQHKAPHRNWMPPLRHLHLYDDVEVPEPPTLFDTEYTDNALPARIQEMEIGRHMHLYYDLFVDPPAGVDKATCDPMHPTATAAAGTLDPSKYPVDRSFDKNRERFTAAQAEEWDAAYGPKNKAFWEANLEGKDMIRWKYQRYMKNYLRCVKAVDENMARVLAKLDELGLDDNTLVVYSSDQGFYLGDHGWYDKRWMYDESLRMPLIMKMPGVIPAGLKCDALVQNLDYAPTFLDLCGVDIPDDMQGQSLLPFLKGDKPAEWRDSIYYRFYEFPSVHMVAHHRGVRNDRYKLIHFYEFDEWEFYDLETDPDELTNQYNNKEYAAAIATMRDELERLRVQYDDNLPEPKPAEWQAKYRK